MTVASTANPSPLTRPAAMHPDHALEDVAQDVALAEAAKPVHRERRMVRTLIFEVELAEPAVGEMQSDLLAEPTLMADAIAVPHQQYPDHQLGIDRGAANVAVQRPQLFV